MRGFEPPTPDTPFQLKHHFYHSKLRAKRFDTVIESRIINYQKRIHKPYRGILVVGLNRYFNEDIPDYEFPQTRSLVCKHWFG